MNFNIDLTGYIENFVNYYISEYQYLLESPKKYHLGKEEIAIIDLENPLVKEVKKFIQENNLLEKGVIISLSGGVDSMVLLAILIRLRTEKNFSIYVVSINYNLRKESKFEANFIKKYCRFYNIIFLVKDIDKTISNEDSQRRIIDNGKLCKRSEYEEYSADIRFKSYKYFLENRECKGVMVGHHKDDIIENIFTNSMKGHNILDLEVMKKVSTKKDVQIFRPLLDFRKSEILEFAHLYNIPYFLDTTPYWSRRGKMRNEIFPLFDEIFSPSWKNKFKEIGDQSNKWNDTIMNHLVEPWIKEASLLENKFIIPIKFTDDENIWLFTLPKLFYKIGHNSIKKKSIIKLLNHINNNDDNFKLTLDSGFVALIKDYNMTIQKEN